MIRAMGGLTSFKKHTDCPGTHPSAGGALRVHANPTCICAPILWMCFGADPKEPLRLTPEWRKLASAVLDGNPLRQVFFLFQGLQEGCITGGEVSNGSGNIELELAGRNNAFFHLPSLEGVKEYILFSALYTSRFVV